MAPATMLMPGRNGLHRPWGVTWLAEPAAGPQLGAGGCIHRRPGVPRRSARAASGGVLDLMAGLLGMPDAGTRRR